MGTHSRVEHTPESIYEALDVLSCHPYSGWENNTFGETLAPHVVHANQMDKPLVCTETFQGSLSDEIRSRCIQVCKQGLKAVSMGYLAF